MAVGSRRAAGVDLDALGAGAGRGILRSLDARLQIIRFAAERRELRLGGGTVGIGLSGDHGVDRAPELRVGFEQLVPQQPDLVLRFQTGATGIRCGDTSVALTGTTFRGDTIEGSNSIRTVGCP